MLISTINKLMHASRHHVTSCIHDSHFENSLLERAGGEAMQAGYPPEGLTHPEPNPALELYDGGILRQLKQSGTAGNGASWEGGEAGADRSGAHSLTVGAELVGNPAARVEGEIKMEPGSDGEDNSRVSKVFAAAGASAGADEESRETASAEESGRLAKKKRISRIFEAIRKEKESAREAPPAPELSSGEQTYLLDSYNREGQYSILGKDSYEWKADVEPVNSYSHKA